MPPHSKSLQKSRSLLSPRGFSILRMREVDSKIDSKLLEWTGVVGLLECVDQCDAIILRPGALLCFCRNRIKQLWSRVLCRGKSPRGVVEISCGLKSGSRLAACAAIASNSSGAGCSAVAKAHAVFEMACGSKSSSRLAACAAIASNSSGAG